MTTSNETCSIMVYSQKLDTVANIKYSKLFILCLSTYFGHTPEQIEQIMTILEYKPKCEVKRFDIKDTDFMNEMIRSMQVLGIDARFEYRTQASPKN